MKAKRWFAALAIVGVAIGCAACAPKETVQESMIGDYTLTEFSVKIGASETKLKPDDADAAKYASLLKLYGTSFSADGSLWKPQGTAFAKEASTGYRIEGRRVVLTDEAVAKMFRSFDVSGNVVTVSIASNGLGLTLVYTKHTAEKPPAPTDGGEDGSGKTDSNLSDDDTTLTGATT